MRNGREGGSKNHLAKLVSSSLTESLSACEDQRLKWSMRINGSNGQCVKRLRASPGGGVWGRQGPAGPHRPWDLECPPPLLLPLPLSLLYTPFPPSPPSLNDSRRKQRGEGRGVSD